MTCVPYNQHFMAFQISFSSQQPTSVQGTFILWYSSWPWRVLVSVFAKWATFWEAVSWLVEHWIHSSLQVFSSLIWFFSSSWRNKTIQFEFVFWWQLFLVLPAYIFKMRGFLNYTHFSTILSKLTSIQTIFVVVVIYLLVKSFKFVFHTSLEVRKRRALWIEPLLVS